MTPTQLLARTDLSWKAKSLALAIAEQAEMFRDGTQIDKIDVLTKMGKEGFLAIHNGLKELESVGVLRRIKIRNPGGPGFVTGSSWEISVVVPLEGVGKHKVLTLP